jgi:hypothetical protein
MCRPPQPRPRAGSLEGSPGSRRQRLRTGQARGPQGLELAGAAAGRRGRPVAASGGGRRPWVPARGPGGRRQGLRPAGAVRKGGWRAFKGTVRGWRRSGAPLQARAASGGPVVVADDPSVGEAHRREPRPRAAVPIVVPPVREGGGVQDALVVAGPTGTVQLGGVGGGQGGSSGPPAEKTALGPRRGGASGMAPRALPHRKSVQPFVPYRRAANAAGPMRPVRCGRKSAPRRASNPTPAPCFMQHRAPPGPPWAAQCRAAGSGIRPVAASSGPRGQPCPDSMRPTTACSAACGSIHTPGAVDLMGARGRVGSGRGRGGAGRRGAAWRKVGWVVRGGVWRRQRLVWRVVAAAFVAGAAKRGPGLAAAPTPP